MLARESASSGPTPTLRGEPGLTAPEAEPALKIRHATNTDVEAWAAMRVALWPDDGRDTHLREARRFFAEPRQGPGTMPEAVLVAEADGTLVGYAEVSRRQYAEGCETSPVGFLEGWYVAPEHRRSGVGRALVMAAEAWARDLGCREFGSDARADNLVSARAHSRSASRRWW